MFFITHTLEEMNLLVLCGRIFIFCLQTLFVYITLQHNIRFKCLIYGILNQKN